MQNPDPVGWFYHRGTQKSFFFVLLFVGGGLFVWLRCVVLFANGYPPSTRFPPPTDLLCLESGRISLSKLSISEAVSRTLSLSDAVHHHHHPPHQLPSKSTECRPDFGGSSVTALIVTIPTGDMTVTLFTSLIAAQRCLVLSSFVGVWMGSGSWLG